MKSTIEIVPSSKHGFRFKATNEIFVYSRKRNIAIKFIAKFSDKNSVTFSIPKRINLLSQELSEKISIIEKENEEENLHKRKTPRKKSEGGFVMLYLEDSVDQSITAYDLYDISSGGMGLKVSDPGEFIQGQILVITSVNTKSLENPIKGKVMSVREMPKDSSFKIGVKFE